MNKKAWKKDIAVTNVIWFENWSLWQQINMGIIYNTTASKIMCLLENLSLQPC